MLSEGSRWGSFLSSSQFLVAAGNPWYCLTHRYITPVFASIFTWHAPSVAVCLVPVSLLIRTSVISFNYPEAYHVVRKLKPHREVTCRYSHGQSQLSQLCECKKKLPGISIPQIFQLPLAIWVFLADVLDFMEQRKNIPALSSELLT